MSGLRTELISTARLMAAAGLNKGSAGNLSARSSGGFWITPTGMPCEHLHPEDLPFMHLDGHWRGRRRPSSEWRFHRDIYHAYPGAGAVLHAHSPYAVSLSCLRRDIPPFHYMIARFGGENVRCSAYATFGSVELSQAALAALSGRRACLLANHGMLVYGRDLGEALMLSIELEDLCGQYWRACQLGTPVELPPEEMAIVLEKFKNYGQPDKAEDRPRRP